jgi:nicotinamidase-related amidase
MRPSIVVKAANTAAIGDPASLIPRDSGGLRGQNQVSPHRPSDGAMPARLSHIPVRGFNRRGVSANVRSYDLSIIREFNRMMRMQRERSQLLIVDLQEKVAPPVHNIDQVIAVCGRLVHIAQRLGVPITLSEHYPKGLGPTVAALTSNLGPDAAVLEKITFSCVKDPALHARFDSFRDHGRGQVIVAGIEAHVCVGQTALDLIAEGYEVYLVADGTSSRTPESRDLSLQRVRQAGAYVVDSEMVLFELLERAGTPEFRDLLALLK